MFDKDNMLYISYDNNDYDIPVLLVGTRTTEDALLIINEFTGEEAVLIHEMLTGFVDDEYIN